MHPLQALAKLIASALVGILSMAGYSLQSPQPMTFGDYNVTGGGTYRIQSSITSTQTTIPLTSFTEPVSKIPYTMTYLNSSIEYGTLEPQSGNKEFISFTGITQNADGSATLTGVTRGLSFSFPFTASTTFQVTHAGQSIFILSNPPQLYGNFLNKSNNETISGFDTFTYAPNVTNVATSSSGVVTLAQLNSTAIQGAATSTITQSGIGLLATGAQAADGTYGSLSDTHFLGTNISTSTCWGQDSYKALITGSTNKISGTCIATSSVDVSTGYAWTASTTYSGILNLGGSQVSINNATFNNPPFGTITKLLQATTTNSATVTTSSTTVYSFVIPANTISTSSSVTLRLNFTTALQTNDNNYMSVFVNATEIGTIGTSTGSNLISAPMNYSGTLDVDIYGAGATNAQEEVLKENFASTGTIYHPIYANISRIIYGTSSFDSTQDQTLTVVARTSAGNTITILNGRIVQYK